MSPGLLEATQKAKIIDVVLIWPGSKSATGATPVLVERICKSLDAGIESVIPLVPALLGLAMDKGQPYRDQG
ncbi:LOW QUALITY PROTEIN: hypothetical protein JCM24511_02036 [Saitozyma sp. JCM 24511]|nr:LOW QUALITY PROTEIN: hypothetical protein JCM24511_02036 [Saitozyma sp. JCM 24511]